MKYLKPSVFAGFAAAMIAGLSGPAYAQVNEAEVVKGYGELVYHNYSDTHQAARAMQQAIDQFLAKPTQAGLEQARAAWLHAREFYGQTEAFRFYGGPVDDENGPEGRMNAWPMDESYVDYVQGKKSRGLINNPKFLITRANLIDQNERGGEENVATGWHAIEFLLWGQDTSATGAGDRPYTDYVEGKAPNAERRAKYLREVTALLVDDLKSLKAAWAPDSPVN